MIYEIINAPICINMETGEHYGKQRLIILFDEPNVKTNPFTDELVYLNAD